MLKTIASAQSLICDIATQTLLVRNLSTLHAFLVLVHVVKFF